MTRAAFRLAALACAAAALGAAACRPSGPPADEDPARRTARLMATAWGPESPAALEKYLAIRKELKPIYDRYQEGVVQWSLREAATRPSLTVALFGVMQLRRTLDEQLKKTGLTDEDYARMTMVVYGRWLRAVRTEDPPEKRPTRALQELAIGLERHLANNPPADEAERKKLEDHLAAVKFQVRYVAPYGLMDKAQTLAKLDKATVSWLEQHRADVEAVDMRLFDTAAPPRQRAEKKASPGATS